MLYLIEYQKVNVVRHVNVSAERKVLTNFTWQRCSLKRGRSERDCGDSRPCCKLRLIKRRI